MDSPEDAPEVSSSLRARFEALHEILVEELIHRVESQDCTHQDLAVAAKFLKDNHIEVSVRAADKGPIRRLVDSMPYEADEDDTGT